VLLPTAPALAQNRTPGGKTPAAKAWTAKTPDGYPDLQGTWDYATITPLERPKQLGDKAFLTDAEAAEYERVTNELQNRDRRDGLGTRSVGSDGRSDVSRAYNEFWWDKGTQVVGTRRTSLIIDPSDGRIPPLTPAGEKRLAERGNGLGARRGAERGEDALDGGPADTWEDRSLWERCLTRNLPRLPGVYNNNIQIIQGADHVVILNEMIHEARVIPLDGRPHVKIGQWLGDSRGRYEGDTLVVDTVGFTDATNFRGSGAGLHLVERYRRTDKDTLIFEVTVEDPGVWTRPWTAQVPMSSSKGDIYEYACHEGNYGLPSLLSGARAMERHAAEAKKGSN
jgi:hypothetical protein